MSTKQIIAWVASIFIFCLVFPNIYTNLWYSQIVDGELIARYFPIKTMKPVSILEEPRQIMINPQQTAFKFGKFTVIPVATFEMQARVLSTDRYYFNLPNIMGTKMDATIFPIDVAFGWKLWDKPQNREKIDVWQTGRFYMWHVDTLEIPLDEISGTSSNMHIIPGSRRVFNTIYAFRKGDLVTLKGYLVNVTSEDGGHWNTSLTRWDTGYGACEIFLVEEAVQN